MGSDFVIDALTRFTHRRHEVLDCHVFRMDLIRVERFLVIEIGDKDHVARGFVAVLRHADFEVSLACNDAATAFEFRLQLDDVLSARATLGAFLQFPHDDVS